MEDGGGGGVRMEGSVYYLSSNKLRLNHPRKRYVILAGNRASSYKEKPRSKNEVPIKSGIIDPDTRVFDHGRDAIHGRVLFVFSLNDPYVHEGKLRFGVRSAEDAAKWMRAFREAAEHQRAQPPGNNKTFLPAAGGRKRFHNLRRSGRRGSGLVRDGSGEGLNREDSTSSLQADLPEANKKLDWTGALLAKDASPDVVASSPWQIFGCKNGLRLFKETSDGDDSFLDKLRGVDPPALMAVGVVKASCASVFELVMALGDSRAEWDFCFLRGRVIEHLHGHTDIIHKQFHSHWLPRRMKPRDLVFQRYWRREDDGSYVILYNSIKHPKCPRSKNFTRAWIKSGGYVISPLRQEKPGVERCMVKHMMTVDWKNWKTFFRPTTNRDMTLIVLERVAAIRELYKVKEGPFMSSERSERTQGPIDDTECFYESEDTSSAEQEKVGPLDGKAKVAERQSTFLQVADDEYFDAEEPQSWQWGDDPTLESSDEMEGSVEEEEPAADLQAFGPQRGVSKAQTIVWRLQDLTSAPKQPSRKPYGAARGLTDEADVEFMVREASLANGTWDMADPATFLIRGKRYLRDNKKVKAGPPVMQLVAADWFKSNDRQDHIASRDDCLVQKLFAKQKSAQKVAESFFFVINLQVPGTPSYSLVLYYMANKSLQDLPLLKSFVQSDDRYRNSRFKLCPHIAKGSWIVKQSVGKSACLVGEALDITYHTSDNYVELDIDIGSSSVAKGVVNLVSGYLGKLVIEMAFLIQANTEEELPEHLLGTVQLSNLDMNKAVLPPPS